MDMKKVIGHYCTQVFDFSPFKKLMADILG